LTALLSVGYELRDYIFLKRFSKAWRASVGREGDGGGATTLEGCE
jgi:hypothetical protein